MKTNWTPGPWVRDDGGGIKAAGTNNYVHHSSAWKEGAWDDSHATEVSRANDHLMAAAPELYDSLCDVMLATSAVLNEAMLLIVKHVPSKHHPSPEKMKKLEAATETARAALAKARGYQK